MSTQQSTASAETQLTDSTISPKNTISTNYTRSQRSHIELSLDDMLTGWWNTTTDKTGNGDDLGWEYTTEESQKTSSDLSWEYVMDESSKTSNDVDSSTNYGSRSRLEDDFYVGTDSEHNRK